MLTRADENLLPCQFVAAIGLRFGFGAQHAQVGTAMGFCEAHGAGPFTAGEFGQIGVFLLNRTVRRQTSVCTMRQAGVHGPCLVGRVEHFKETLIDYQRKCLTTVFLFGAEGGPACFDVFLVSLFEACRRCNFMGVSVELATFFITRNIEWENHLRCKFATLFQHRIDGVCVGFGMLGHGLQFVFQIEQLVQHKLHVTQWRDVAWHGWLSEKN